MFRDTIKKRVMKQITERIDKAQETYDLKAKELDDIAAESKKMIDAKLETDKSEALDELAIGIIGKII